MKIGVYVHWAGVGGAEDMAIDEIRYADRNRFNYTFFTEEDSGWGPCLQELKDMDVPVVRLSHRPEAFLEEYKAMGIQLVHAFSCGDVQPGYEAALRLGLPVVDTAACVGYSAGYERAPHLVRPVYLCQKHWEHGGGGKPEFKVIVGGVDLQRLHVHGTRSQCKQHWGLDPTRLVFGFFGRFDQFKCPYSFVEMANELHKQLPDAQFIMFGDGPDKGRSEFLAKQYKLDIRFPGFTREKALAFGAMDVFVFPTWQEAFGRVMVEAMALGVPIVTADYPVCHEVCGQAAVYVTNERADPMSKQNIAEYADRARGLIVDREMYNAMAGLGFERARANFSAARMAREYGALYEEMRK